MTVKSGKFSVLSVAMAGSLAALPARAEEAGLPQLDTAMFPEQIFWLAIFFALLYFLMSRVAMPRIAKTQDNRHRVIAGELQAARDAGDAAKSTAIQVDKLLLDARAKAEASVNEMIAAVSAEAAEKQAAQEKQMLRQLRNAEQDIAVTREAALQSVRGSAGELALSMVDKIIGAGKMGAA